MKKLFTIIGVLLVSIFGVFAGCGESKYANMKIDVSSAALVGDVLTIGYGNSVTVTAKGTGAEDINSAVHMSCSDTEALDIIGVVNDENGTTATIKANKPTYDKNYFVLKFISAETSDVFREIKVKVVLPITGLDFGESKLSVSPSNPLNLYDFLNFYPQKPYVTNQKDVVWDIADYGYNNANFIHIDNETGYLTVDEGVIDNLTTDESCLSVTVTSKEKAGINYTVKVNVVKDLVDSDLTIESPQLSYNNVLVPNKADLKLFTNSSKFYEEEVIVSVASSQDIDIVPIKEGDGNIIEISKKGAIIKTPIDGVRFKNTVTFKIRAKSTAGLCSVRFKVITLNINNSLTFEFSDVTAIDVSTSALPKQISLRQDNQNIDQEATFPIYNEYVATESSSGYGSKIVPVVSSESSTSVSEQNKYVKVEIINVATDNEALGDFILTDVRGNVLDTTGGYIEILSNNIFYLKATDGAVGKTYRITFSTLIKDFVTYASGGSPSLEDETVIANYFISANYGVKQITFEKENYVIKRSTYSSPEYTENMIRFTVNENADINGMVADYDTSMLTVTKIDTFSYVVVGRNLGTTDFRVTAKNGCTKKVTIKIVDPMKTVNLSVDSPISNQVITETNYVNNTLLNVSAKVGGKFNVYTATSPNLTGILKTEFKSTDEAVATISNSGILTTKNAGTTFITATIQYYDFSNGMDSYATCEVLTTEVSFELIVFTPTNSIELSRYAANIYSSDSLGFEYASMSEVEVFVLVSPVTATIYGDDSAITYELVNNNGVLKAAENAPKGKFLATLPEGVDEATILVVVTVEEFGTSVSLTCTVNVKRAKQIEEIIIDNLKKPNEIYLLEMKEDETFNLEITLYPTEVLIPDLKMFIYDEAMTPINTATIVTINGKSIISKPTLDAADPESVFIRIYAKDSMTSLDDGPIFVTILVKIETGSLKSPYIVNNAEELQAIKNAPSKHYMLGADIDLNGRKWEPINNFSGSLNGLHYVTSPDGTEVVINQQHTIINLYLETAGEQNVGLFGSTELTGLIINLDVSVAGASITNNSALRAVGGLVGYHEGIIVNSTINLGNSFSVSATLTDMADDVMLDVGGMVGTNKGYVYNFAPYVEDAFGRFNRAYTAEHLRDVSIPSGYESIVFGKDSYLTFAFKYAEGDVPATTIEQVATMIDEAISQTPVTGRLQVMDSPTCPINAGGVVGRNLKAVNGIYGLYNVQEETSGLAGGTEEENEFLISNSISATINSAGRDFSGVLYTGGRTLNRLNSTVGGIVGLNNGGGIYNVAATGRVEGYYNVGGIVGKTITNATIKTISSSARITGSQNVGGAIGYSDSTNVTLAKVENYQETSEGGDILIRGTHNVGGVAGYFKQGALQYAYAVSFVEENTFMAGGMSNYKADIYNNGNDIEMYVGGVVGFADTNAQLSFVYSTMSIFTSTANTGSFAGGIAGVMSYRATIQNAYYLGKFIRNPSTTGCVTGKIDEQSATSNSGVESPIKLFFSNSGQMAVGQDTKSFFNNADPTVVRSVTQNSQLAPFKDAVSTSHWDVASELNKKDGVSFPVIKYNSAILEREVYFIKQTPTSVTVSIKTPTDGANTYAKLESNVILMTYSANKTLNTYAINKLMKFTWSPASITSSQLRVTSTNPNVVEVKEGGELVIKDVSELGGIGYATLTFTSVLNLNAFCTVDFVVIPRVTTVKLYNDSNLTQDLLVTGELSMKKGTTQKLFPTYYDTDENGKLVKVKANYYADYEQKTPNEFFTINEATNIVEASKETLVKTDPNYETEREYYLLNFSSNIKVPYTVAGAPKTKDFNPFAGTPNNKKTIEIDIYTGATDLEISPNSSIDVSSYLPRYVDINLISDAKVDGVEAYITDEKGNKIYKTYTADGERLYINGFYYDLSDETEKAEAQAELDRIGFILDVEVLQTYFIMTFGNYTAEIYLKIAEGKEYFINPITYTITFTAFTSPSIQKSINVVCVPQPLLHLDSNYKVLDGQQATGAGATSFIFETNPRDKIIPGKLGLISIDTAPIYAGVEYFKIETTEEAMKYVNFAQLYKDKSPAGSGISYVFGTEAEKLPNGLKLNRQSNYLRTEYVYQNGEVTDTPIEDSNNYNYNIIAVNNIYDFDGNLYIEILTSNSIYEIDSFPVTITAVYADRTEQVFNRTFETTFLPALTLETSRNYIALGTRDDNGSSLKDTVTITPVVDGDYDVTMEMSVSKHDKDLPASGVAVLRNDNTLILDANAQAGDKIVITASYNITVEGRTEVVTTSTTILVVDAIIDKVDIEKAVDSKLMFTISSSQQLQASIKGCAEQGVLSRLSTILSRQMTASNTIAYWKYVYSNGEMTNLDNKALSLPFGVDVKKVSTGEGLGLASVSLVGAAASGSANLKLRAYMYYNEEGELQFAETIDETAKYPTLIDVPFTAQVMVDSTDDLPEPIYSVGELYSMAEGGNYILMNDLEITEPHTPISAKVASFDGNNKIITIRNFSYSTSAESMTSTSINLGLFDTVAQDSVIKNVIVALPNDKRNAMLLNNYTDINFGGIAGINNGLITNCEIISVYDRETYEEATKNAASTGDPSYLYPYISYTFNIYTAVTINGTAVNANIGGLVGKNSNTGVITNSRVGREKVDFVSIQEDDYNGTNPIVKTYDYTAPITVMKLEGSGNIGGFIAVNEGIISSSYYNNGQMEISSYGSNYTKTGGFVAVNSGAIYSSYVAGWEEETFLKAGGSTEGLYSYLLSINPDGNSNYQVSLSKTNPNRKLGGGIYSNGNIGGFVYQNKGYIQNSYSNIGLNGDFTFAANRQNISVNAQLTEYGNLNAGGFVYINDSKAQVKTSYTISKIKSNISTHGPFVGVSPLSGDVQNEGEVDKSYYLIESGESIYSDSDPAYDISQMSDDELGDDVASIGNEFIIKDTFAGFSFDNNNYTTGMTSGAVWAMKIVTSPYASNDNQDNYGYPEIVSANQIAISVRVLKPNTEAPEGQPDYTYIYALGYEKGSEINPQIVTSAAEYNKIFDNILGVTIPVENVSVKYTGNIRLVNNLDFMTLTPSSTSFEYTSPINKLSVFDGNNLAISNVLISDNSESNTAFGLFKTLNGVGVKNLTLTIRGVDSTNGVAVGALTGIAVESDINNINIMAAIKGAEVSGQNYVGGLAGIVVSGDDYVLHYINNINCNVSVLAGYNGDTNTQIIKPGEVWSLIVPPAKINPYSTDYNLRLQYLKTNVSYAGGIAGVIDLVQAYKSAGEDASTESLDYINARAINVSKPNIFYNPEVVTIEVNNIIGIEAEYAGGLFGFVGNQTFIREGSFVAYEESETHYIMADIAAGGITAINYGFIDQTSVTFDKNTQATLDNQLESLVKGASNITWGNQALFTGSPIYIGGITGINIGGAVKNTGTIQNSYNRIDLINKNATRIGGIAGASHVGAMVNVYTTANIYGDFSKEVSYFGAIVGQLLNNENNRFYSISLSKDKENNYNLEFTNISTATVWNPDFFEDYKKYTDAFGTKYYKTYSYGDVALAADGSERKDKDGNPVIVGETTADKLDPADPIKTIPQENDYVVVNNNKVVTKVGRIGLLYGAPTSADAIYIRNSELNADIAKKPADQELRDDYFNPYKWYDHYVTNFSGTSTVLVDKIYKSFKETELDYIDMFCGLQATDSDSVNISDADRDYRNKEPRAMFREEGSLYYFLNYDLEQAKANILSKDEIIDLFTIEIGAGSNAKDKVFSKSYWSSRIWKFEDTERLIKLNFGYIPSVARIYTAEDYIREINDSPASKKYYYIMNDIDFSTVTDEIVVLSNFRGTVTGIRQKNEDESVSRYPILYNISLSDKLPGEKGGGVLNDTAMFVNTTNASFFNLNIVIKSYEEEAPGLNDPAVVKKSGILIANATNTSVNNVHISYKLSHFTNGFLTGGISGGGKVLLEDMKRDGLTATEFEQKLKEQYDQYAKENTTPLVVKTRATFFGGIVANGLSSRIRDCSYNIPTEVVYNNAVIPGDSEIFFGGVAGRMLGSVSSSFATRNITISALENTTNVKYFYLGGVIGYAAGDMNNLGYGYPTATVNNDPFVAKWKAMSSNKTECGQFIINNSKGGYLRTSQKTYVGGVIGYSTLLVDTTTTLTSRVSSAYNYNASIGVRVEGYLNVGGVIGSNDVEASNLEYKGRYLNTTCTSDIGDCAANQKTVLYVNSEKNTTINVGGIIGDNNSDYTLESTYTNTSINIAGTTSNSVIANIGGIVGQTKNILLQNSINDSYGMLIAARYGTINVGGLIGKAIGTASSLTLNYVVSTSYIKIKAPSAGDKDVNIGGLVGLCESQIVVYNAINLGNLYIDKYCTISTLRAGGLVGQTKSLTTHERGLGAVIASNINYRNIAGNETFSIGQIIGSLSATEGDSATSCEKIYFSENLFGLYTNKYGEADLNVNMEDLATPLFNIVNYKQDTTVINGLTPYFQRFEAGATQGYASMLTNNVVYNKGDNTFAGVSGSKINPAALASGNIAELGTKTFNYYKMTADVAVSSTIANLNTGNFIDARGYAINVNSYSAPVFDTVAAEAMVIGMLIENAAINNANSATAPIALTNNGSLLGCGTAGSVSSKTSAAGIVHTNNGNIINCFSIANIVVTTENSTVAGFVNVNKGNIITSYYTGTITNTLDYVGGKLPTGVSGFIYNNESTGLVANSYTMSNILNAELLKDKISYMGPIISRGTQNLINVYYDKNAYIGTAVAAAYRDARGKTTAQLSKLGVDATPKIAGNWFNADAGDIKVLWMVGYKDLGYDEKFISVDASWFNYSYSVANVNGNIPTIDGIKRFLQMIYTGNGKKDDGNSTNYFKNQPFKITNAGMIEAYFLTNVIQNAGSKSYYILQNNISFGAYDEWSDAWNKATDNPVQFTGDFNGNNKVMYALASSKYGIFRLLGTNAEIYDFTITDIHSQSGLLAGAIVKGAIVRDIIVESSSSLGGNYKACSVTNTNMNSLNSTKAVDLFNGKYISGGLIGYATGGDIQNITLKGSLTINAGKNRSGSDSYAGGIVGYVVGQDTNIDIAATPFNDMSLSVIADYAGGMLGYTENPITGYTLGSNVTVQGADAAGGFIGIVGGDKPITISNLYSNDQNIKGVTLATTETAYNAGGIVGIVNTTSQNILTISGCKNASDIGGLTNAGGIVGDARYVIIKESFNSAGVTIKTNYYAGGLVGYVDYLEFTGQGEGSYNTDSSISGMVVGGIAGYMNNGKISGTASSMIKNEASITATHSAGNVVGTIESKPSTDVTLVDTGVGVMISNVHGDVSNLSATGYAVDNMGGLVGKVVANNLASVKIYDLKISGSKTAFATYSGGGVGYASGLFMIYNVTIDSLSLTLDSYDVTNVGGVVGYVPSASNGGTGYNIYAITSGSVSVNVSASTGIDVAVGGVVGEGVDVKINSSTLTFSFTEYIMGSSTYFVGGAVGIISSSLVQTATVANSTITIDSIAGDEIDFAGGIAGYADTAIIKACTVNIKDEINIGQYAGGIAGYAINSSFNNDGTTKMNVIAAGSSDVSIAAQYAGGIVGYGEGVTFNSGEYLVSMTGTSSYIHVVGNDSAGGIMGVAIFSSPIDTTVKFKSAAKVTGYEAGGLFGKLLKGTITGEVSTGTTAITNNLVVNNVVTGTYTGYLAGTVNSSSGVISISTIKIPTSNSAVNNFTMASNSSTWIAGGVIGRVMTTNNLTISSITNNKNYSITTAVTRFGGIIGLLDSASASLTGLAHGGDISFTANVLTADNVDTTSYVGGIIGEVTQGSTISDSTNSGNITSNAGFVGGIVGYADAGTFTNCKNTGDLTNTDATAGAIGGVIANVAGTLTISTSKAMNVSSGDITSSYYAGGIVGLVNAGTLTIKGVDTKNRISSSATILGVTIGGLIGKITASAVDMDFAAYSGTSIGESDTILAENSGGIVGVIDSAFNAGVVFTDVTVDNDALTIQADSNAGGVAGTITSTDSVTMASIIVNAEIVGHSTSGMITYANSSSVIISDSSVKTSEITGSSGYAAGIIGSTYNCYGITISTCTIDEIDVYNDPTACGAGLMIGRFDNTTGISITGSTISNSKVHSKYAGGVIGDYFMCEDLSASNFSITLTGNTVISGLEEQNFTGYAGTVISYLSGSDDDIYLNSITIGAGNTTLGDTSGSIATAYDVNIYNLYVNNKVSYTTNGKAITLGGIVGNLGGCNIYGCRYNVDINATLTDAYTETHFGGMVGYAYDSYIYDCDFTGALGGSNYYNYKTSCGGVVGTASSSTIEWCYINAKHVYSGSYGGGIVGSLIGSGSKILRCKYISGQVNVKNYSGYGSDSSNCDVYCGGIVGRVTASSATVTNCQVNTDASIYSDYNRSDFSYGSISASSSTYSYMFDDCETNSSYDGISTNYGTGGIVGYWSGSSGTLSNCSAMCTDITAYVYFTNLGRIKNTAENTGWSLGVITEFSGYSNVTMTIMSGAIIGYRGSVSISNCNYNSNATDRAKATKGCGGTFYGSDSWNFWGGNISGATNNAINNAINSGRTSGDTSGISTRSW